jgi:DhnA family fructose-bisphosphate aldolase class Ia
MIAAGQNFEPCEGAEIDAVAMSGGMLGWQEKKIKHNLFMMIKLNSF